MQNSQATMLLNARGEYDDLPTGKGVHQFSPFLGVKDGTNLVFQIPQPRIVSSSLIIFKNQTVLPGSDYTLTDPINSFVTYVVAPKPSDSISGTFNYEWFTDIELDHFMNRSANELGYPTYYTNPPSPDQSAVPGSEAIPTMDIPTDFPSGLLSALIYGGAYRAANALATRLGTRYDSSTADQSFSPSQMAEMYDKLATRLQKYALTARDDFYKGQGRQYRPAIAAVGYVLPPYTPRR